ncbi:shikimate kinase [Streptococcus sp. DD12]|uniref:shikimate kinase n=1 Tax=Streptococcus sp. DD12 TaxID=1777880 RepID=UPI000796A0A8|nr:shikimate kinase [Streptococcus sp. DD12]KXT77025.1 Shikimate kinase I [Streptococcus sp. DD12]
MAKVLIGFMGAGKTTVARLLDPDFIDMDAVITDRIGMSIADYFAKEGEAAFRCVESQVLAELLTTDAVISTGGGVVISPANRDLLRQKAHTIFLKADLATLVKRIQKDQVNKRPLFENNDAAEFAQLFEQRQAFYEEAANQVIDVSDKSPQEIVELIK